MSGNIATTAEEHTNIHAPLPEGCSTDAVLKDLQDEIRMIGKMKPHLSALAKLHKEKKSQIDQFVEWYTDKPWWGKLLTGGTVVSVTYTLGAFVGVAWLLTGLVTALYATVSSIIEEHASIMKKRGILFLDDIQKMEASIEASIQSFRLLEDQLNTVFQSLNTLHTQRSEGIDALEGNVDTLEGQNVSYALMIESLGNITEKLSQHQGNMALNEVELGMLSLELHNSLTEAKALCTKLSGLVSTVAEEMEDNQASPDAQPAQPVHMSKQVEEDLDAFDREIEALAEPGKKSNLNTTSSVSHADEDLNDIDEALHELQRADKASKEAHVTQVNQKQDGRVFTIPHLF